MELVDPYGKAQDSTADSVDQMVSSEYGVRVWGERGGGETFLGLISVFVLFTRYVIGYTEPYLA